MPSFSVSKTLPATAAAAAGLVIHLFDSKLKFKKFFTKLSKQHIIKPTESNAATGFMRFHGIRFTTPQSPNINIAFVVKKSPQSAILLDIEETAATLQVIIQQAFATKAQPFILLNGIKSFTTKRIILNVLAKRIYEHNLGTNSSSHAHIKTHTPHNPTITIVDPTPDFKRLEYVIRELHIGDLARHIASEPSNLMSPSNVVKYTQGVFKNAKGVKITVFDDPTLVKMGFGLIHAVGKGSAHPPMLLILERIVKNSKNMIAMIGKGVCFDSGGYNLKPGRYMEGMQFDKTGASVAISAFKHFTETNKRDSIVALVPLVENLISGTATRPGDVVVAWNKKKVEIGNTDAEGRLIMADALSYACAKYKPTLIMNFATLTGWASNQHCGASFVYYTNSERYSQLVQKSGAVVGERSIRLPPWPEFMKYTTSDIADYRNDSRTCVGDGNMAAMFLLNFIPPKYRNKWIHFDITSKGETHTHPCNSLPTLLELLSRAAPARHS